MKQVKMYVRGICKNTGSFKETCEGKAIVILEYMGRYKQIRMKEEHTTANRMILKGILVGLEKLKEPCEVIVHTHNGTLGFKKLQKSPNKDLLEGINRIIAEGGHVLEIKTSQEHQKELIQLLKVD